jgi:hypothetical protein
MSRTLAIGDLSAPPADHPGVACRGDGAGSLDNRPQLALAGEWSANWTFLGPEKASQRPGHVILDRPLLRLLS